MRKAHMMGAVEQALVDAGVEAEVRERVLADVRKRVGMVRTGPSGSVGPRKAYHVPEGGSVALDAGTLAPQAKALLACITTEPKSGPEIAQAALDAGLLVTKQEPVRIWAWYRQALLDVGVLETAYPSTMSEAA